MTDGGFALGETAVDPPLAKVFPKEDHDQDDGDGDDGDCRTFVAHGAAGDLAGFVAVSYSGWNRRLTIEDIEIAPELRSTGAGGRPRADGARGGVRPRAGCRAPLAGGHQRQPGRKGRTRPPRGRPDHEPDQDPLVQVGNHSGRTSPPPRRGRPAARKACQAAGQPPPAPPPGNRSVTQPPPSCRRPQIPPSAAHVHRRPRRTPRSPAARRPTRCPSRPSRRPPSRPSPPPSGWRPRRSG